MEQIAQLRAMRDAAKNRLMASPDWKLMVALDALIPDLEKAFGLSPAEDAGAGDAEETDEEEPALGSADPNAQAPVAPFEVQDRIEENPVGEPEPVEDEMGLEVDLEAELETAIEESISVVGEAEEGSPLAEGAGAAIGEQSLGDDLTAHLEGAPEELEEDAVSRALDELSIDLEQAAREEEEE